MLLNAFQAFRGWNAISIQVITVALGKACQSIVACQAIVVQLYTAACGTSYM